MIKSRPEKAIIVRVMFSPIVSFLISTFALQDDENRLEENDDVVPERPVPYIPAIEIDALAISRIAAAAHLPEARHARPHRQVIVNLFGVIFFFILDDGARAHEAHVAAQDIEKLRELVKA